MNGDGRYRGEANDVFYRQLIEDQKENINRKIQ